MTQKHTPGPWKVYDAEFGASEGQPKTALGHLDIRKAIEDKSSGHGLPLFTILGPSEDHFRQICHADPIYNGERNILLEEANARLIAAAPDLLEALKGTLHRLQMLNVHDNHPTIEKAIAAIQKAEGK